MKLFQLFFFVFIFGIAFASAETQQSFITGQAANITQQCYNNGTYCGPTAVCSITITDPLENIVINNLNMTNQYSYHNYTLDSTQTSTSGEWSYSMVCSEDELSNFNEFTFTVNPGGVTPSQEKTDSISRGVWIILAVGLVIFFVGSRADFVPLKLSLYIVGAIFLMVSLNLTLIGLQDDIVNPSVIGLFDTLIASSYYLYWFAALMIFFIWFITIFKTMEARLARKKAQRIEGVF